MDWIKLQDRMPDDNIPVKIQTIVGELIAKKVTYAHLVFFVSEQIPENKHWATFTPSEVFNWKPI